MRRCFTLALAAAAALGCADDTSPTGVGAVLGREANGRGAMAVKVVGFRAFPDSSYIDVRGARVELSLIDTLPTDTSGTPPESLMVAGLSLDLLGRRPVSLDSFPDDTLPTDTIPTDTIPTDTIPTDTIPPDSNPPPPPPGCGRTGTLVAVGRTNERGELRISRLRAGIYDLKVIPPERSGFATGYLCSALVQNERTAGVRVTLFPAPSDSLTQ